MGKIPTKQGLFSLRDWLAKMEIKNKKEMQTSCYRSIILLNSKLIFMALISQEFC